MDIDSDSDISLLGDDVARTRGKGKSKATDKRKKDKGKGKAKDARLFSCCPEADVSPIRPASIYMGGLLHTLMGHRTRG